MQSHVPQQQSGGSILLTRTSLVVSKQYTEFVLNYTWEDSSIKWKSYVRYFYIWMSTLEYEIVEEDCLLRIRKSPHGYTYLECLIRLLTIEIRYTYKPLTRTITKELFWILSSDVCQLGISRCRWRPLWGLLVSVDRIQKAPAHLWTSVDVMCFHCHLVNHADFRGGKNGKDWTLCHNRREVPSKT